MLDLLVVGGADSGGIDQPFRPTLIGALMLINGRSAFGQKPPPRASSYYQPWSGQWSASHFTTSFLACATAIRVAVWP